MRNEFVFGGQFGSYKHISKVENMVALVVGMLNERGPVIMLHAWAPLSDICIVSLTTYFVRHYDLGGA